MKNLELLPLALRCSVCGRLSNELTECERCGKYCCEGCISEEYNPLTFSYWDGSVETDVICADCNCWEPNIGVYR